ncbi:unnamed protein product [Soboliphyme baturini]|uniref:DUF4371 domain-containing protein n=1 Tax=Soboliphyme baturini TaxID=241478 RepID=A0A183IKS4_9BILA|nr:unnamed protein product [Soboliphyme baturini]
MNNFYAHVGVDAKEWNGVIGENGPSDLSKLMSIMNTFFEHRKVHQYAWYREASAKKSMIDLIIVSSELREDHRCQHVITLLLAFSAVNDGSPLENQMISTLVYGYEGKTCKQYGGTVSTDRSDGV